MKQFIENTFNSIKNLYLLKKIIILSLLLISILFTYQLLNNRKSVQPTFQTAIVKRENLIVTVSASGTVSSVNNSSVTTQATGVVKTIYVKDGDTVSAGDKIAELDLDLSGKQRYSQYLASYQSAKNAVESAQATMYSLQADMLTNWDEFYELATNDTYENSDGTPNYINRALPEYHISEKKWLSAEAKYKNQQNVVTQAQTALQSAWYSYQQNSPIIYAPITGTVSGFSLQIGTVISSSGSSTDETSTKIASVNTNAQPTIQINLTEIDIPKVKIDNVANITIDAISDKKFSGKVISIDKNGSVSSGVTTYPVVILLETNNANIYPNMAVSATIETQSKNNVLTVPLSALQNQNGKLFVRIQVNNKIIRKPVTIGVSTDNLVEIITGLDENDIIITSNISSTTSSQNGGQTQSPFSPFSSGRTGSGIMRMPH
jgi:HlyD family secretion protein